MGPALSIEGHILVKVRLPIGRVMFAGWIDQIGKIDIAGAERLGENIQIFPCVGVVIADIKPYIRYLSHRKCNRLRQIQRIIRRRRIRWIKICAVSAQFSKNVRVEKTNLEHPKSTA